MHHAAYDSLNMLCLTMFRLQAQATILCWQLRRCCRRLRILAISVGVWQKLGRRRRIFKCIWFLVLIHANTSKRAVNPQPSMLPMALSVPDGKARPHRNTEASEDVEAQAPPACSCVSSPRFDGFLPIVASTTSHAWPHARSIEGSLALWSTVLRRRSPSRRHDLARFH